jgi:hypothetical protein
MENFMFAEISSVIGEINKVIRALGINEVLVAVVGMVVTVFIAVFTGGIKWAMTTLRHAKDGIHVRSAKHGHDQDIEQFQELYERTIEDRQRIRPSEIIAWIDDQARWDGLEHRLLLCKKNNTVIGFAQLMCCSLDKYAYISYFAIDDKDPHGRQLASRSLVQTLKRIVRKNLRRCESIVFEVESPDAPGLDPKEKSERRARIRRLKELARDAKTQAFEIGMDYIQPEFPTDNPLSNQHHATLLFVTLNKSKQPLFLESKEMIEILRFLYFRVYGPVYQDDDELNKTYRAELRSLLDSYRSTLPHQIRLIA